MAPPRARYGPPLSPEQPRALRAIAVCRTAALGGHATQCARCGHEEISSNSCRNRHCPKCQGAPQATGLAAREREVLDVPYVHVVFTLPPILSPLCLHNPRGLSGFLVRTVAQTLQDIAGAPQPLGADSGGWAVLHTWGQPLHHHPPLHGVLPAGGLAPDETRWLPCRPHFCLPVQVLSRRFRRLCLTALEHVYSRGERTLGGRCQERAAPQPWQRFLGTLWSTAWGVYAKEPLRQPQHLFKYLARYTHRVAITPQRLVALEHGQVVCRWKAYTRGHRLRTMTWAAVAFLRRVMLHVLPRGLQRIRHCGFLAHRIRETQLAGCRGLLQPQAGVPPALRAAAEASPTQDDAGLGCPACQCGRMCWGGTRRPQPLLFARDGQASGWDTS